MRARTGTAQLPLHGGKARSIERARALKRLVKFGEERVRRRMADHRSPDQKSPDQPSPDHRSPDRR